MFGAYGFRFDCHVSGGCVSGFDGYPCRRLGVPGGVFDNIQH